MSATIGSQVELSMELEIAGAGFGPLLDFELLSRAYCYTLCKSCIFECFAGRVSSIALWPLGVWQLVNEPATTKESEQDLYLCSNYSFEGNLVRRATGSHGVR